MREWNVAAIVFSASRIFSSVLVPLYQYSGLYVGSLSLSVALYLLRLSICIVRARAVRV